ncbi:MAG: ETC complex I subunit [Pseudomonadota bacterium]
MQVRIYRPSKTATQSGRANEKHWVLEFEPTARREADPLMGWTASGDTNRQLRLYFGSEAEAVAYARKNGLAYCIVEPQERIVRPKSYADNFRFDRIGRWTH